MYALLRNILQVFSNKQIIIREELAYHLLITIYKLTLLNIIIDDDAIQLVRHHPQQLLVLRT